MRLHGLEVEGFRTTEIVYSIAQKIGIDMPITSEIYRLMHGIHSPRQAVDCLMTRSKKNETDKRLHEIFE